MRIKDFKAGQDAWLFYEKGCVEKVTVSRVGRKYVCVQNFGYEKQYKECGWCTEGLIENRDWGERAFLFPTEEKMLEFQERGQMEDWLYSTVCRGIKNRFSLEQLRKAKEILEGA